MLSELCKYLFPDISQWLVKEIIQQPIILADFIKTDVSERMLYITPDYTFLYTFSSVKREIRMYDLSISEMISCNKVKDEYEYPFMKSIQHPQWIGFLCLYDYEHFLKLVDIVTDEVLHTWSIRHDIAVVEYGVMSYTWDEDIGILIPLSPSSAMLTTFPLTFNDLKPKASKVLVENFIKKTKRITDQYICYALSFEDGQIGFSFEIMTDRDYTTSVERGSRYLYKNILHIFFHDDNLLKTEYPCPHIVNYYSNNTDKDVWVQNNFIVLTHGLQHSIVQCLQTITNNSICNCK